MKPTTKILISACLLGEPVRYDGQSKPLAHTLLNRWRLEHRLIRICPELAGGLQMPREAAEIYAGDGISVLMREANVMTATQIDKSAFFLRGAKETLKMARQHDIKIALLKANSPSCSNQKIYNGLFSGETINGMGVTAALLSKNGISVYNEKQVLALERELRKLDQANSAL